MVNREQLIVQLNDLLKKAAPDCQPELLDPRTNMMTGLQMDSWDFLQFIIAIDKSLHVNIPEEDYGKVMTMEALTAYLLPRIPSTP